MGGFDLEEQGSRTDSSGSSTRLLRRDLVSSRGRGTGSDRPELARSGNGEEIEKNGTETEVQVRRGRPSTGGVFLEASALLIRWESRRQLSSCSSWSLLMDKKYW